MITIHMRVWIWSGILDVRARFTWVNCSGIQKTPNYNKVKNAELYVSELYNKYSFRKIKTSKNSKKWPATRGLINKVAILRDPGGTHW